MIHRGSAFSLSWELMTLIKSRNCDKQGQTTHSLTHSINDWLMFSICYNLIREKSVWMHSSFYCACSSNLLFSTELLCWMSDSWKRDQSASSTVISFTMSTWFRKTIVTSTRAQWTLVISGNSATSERSSMSPHYGIKTMSRCSNNNRTYHSVEFCAKSLVE